MSGYALALARRAGILAMTALWLLTSSGAAGAASLSARDAQIIAKILGFLDPAPSGGTVAVLYASGVAGSKADADAIVALFGDGLPSGGGLVRAKPIAVASFGDGRGYVAVILAAGAEGDGSALSALRGVLSITAADALVKSGHCVMAVHSQPRVDITISRNAVHSAGINFTAAFGMLVHEE